jgi:glutamate carboxypeptidase
MPTHPEVREYFQRRLPDYLELLRQMVAINSFTANPQGINSLGELTARFFSQLDFEPEFVQSEQSRYGRHLFLKRRASERNPGRRPKTLALVAHLDTVFPPEEEIANDFSWRPEGERIYGPGTVDIKGGTAMIYAVLEAMQAHAPRVFEGNDWYICLNATEEVLSDEFGRLCLERLPADTFACLVFEGGTKNSMTFPIVTARKGRATFRVTVEGRSAHAGNNHPQGANAILQMAHTIQQIEALTDYNRQLTFNVGYVSGGVVVNRVPHMAEASVEMRTFSPIVFQQGVSSMLALRERVDVTSQDGYPCKVEVTVEEQTDPWPANPETQRLYEHWQMSASEVGLRVITEERGGLSDGNLLWRHFPTLDGLGPTGANAHCSERSPDGSKEQEYLLVPSFVPKALLNYTALVSLVGN